MAGVKGRSGRKKATFQEARSRVIDKAWELIAQVLENPDTKMTAQIEIARAIVVKNIPQAVEGGGNTSIVINVINAKTEDRVDSDGIVHGYRAQVPANN